MLTFIPVIPSKEAPAPGEALNVLGGAANHGEAITAEITVWGRTEGDWRALVTRSFRVEAGEHKHLYFTLSPELLSPRFWGGEIDALELRISDRKPSPLDRGKAVFPEPTA